jgi:hypothetical protein
MNGSNTNEIVGGWGLLNWMALVIRKWQVATRFHEFLTTEIKARK